jgi:glutaconate CoA-transferase subunit B
VITTLAVFRFEPDTAEMVLASYHPGQSVDRVRQATGWALRVAPARARRPPRPPRRSRSCARGDPLGFWTR